MAKKDKVETISGDEENYCREENEISDMSWDDDMREASKDEASGGPSHIPMEVDEEHSPESMVSLIQETVKTIEEELNQKKAEISFFSEEIFVLRDETISIRTGKKNVENQILSLTRKVESTQLSRDKYKKKAEYLLKKLQRSSKKKFRGVRPKIYSGKPRRNFKYSTLDNPSTKRGRVRSCVEALQNIAMEDDIHEILDDVIQYCDKSPLHSFSLQLSVWQAVVLQSKANLSLNQISEIKKSLKLFTGRDVFPPVKNISKLAKSESMIHLYQGSTAMSPLGKTVSIAQCVDIRKVIEWKLEHVAHRFISDEFTGDDLVLGIGIDAGGGSTKVCLMFGNLDKPSSLNNLLLLAMYSDEDSYDNIRTYINPLVDQINALDYFTYSHNDRVVTKRVRLYFIGDFKVMMEVLGHERQGSTFFCYLCEATNTNRGARKSTLENLDLFSWPQPRTMASYEVYSVDGRCGVKEGRLPLFKNIHLRNHLAGMLHCIMGLFQKYVYWPLWHEVVSRDNTSQFTILSTKDSTLAAADRTISNIKESLGTENSPIEKAKKRAELKELQYQKSLLNQAIRGHPNGYLKHLEKQWESLGASRRAYFQIFNGNHTAKILGPDGVRVTFEVFDHSMNDKLRAVRGVMEQLSVIMALCANRVLTPFELDQVKECISRTVTYLKRGFPDESITPKLHYLLFHVPEVGQREKTLGIINEQGLEATHARVNHFNRRFSSIRNESDRFLYCIQEMNCLGLAEDV